MAGAPPTTTTTPSRGGGCPAGGDPDEVSAITSPENLLIDGQTSDPGGVPSGVQTLVVRYHVTSTCGGPVQGALVCATATPFNQFSIPPETPTGADGWAELRFQRQSAFPVSPKQELIAIFAPGTQAGRERPRGNLGAASLRDPRQPARLTQHRPGPPVWAARAYRAVGERR